jgi:CRP/FNR family transcriptional regulator, cyclic AMP receptor protein
MTILMTAQPRPGRAEASRLPLLDADPELGDLLRGDRAAAARRDLRLDVCEIARGEWHPSKFVAPQRGSIGVLVLEGVVSRQLRIQECPSVELLGPMDIISSWHGQDDPHAERWSALEPLTIGLLDGPRAAAIARYPEILLVLLERSEARARRLAHTQAISQLTGVDRRVEALLWHLADRFGKVRLDGVALTVDLSHRMIGDLIGARRPTVSAAIARLIAENRISREAGGRWVLHADASAGVAALAA